MTQKTKEYIVATIGIAISLGWICYSLFLAPPIHTPEEYEWARFYALLWWFFNIGGLGVFFVWRGRAKFFAEKEIEYVYIVSSDLKEEAYLDESSVWEATQYILADNKATVSIRKIELKG